jgi:hypothetical protein
MARSSSDKDTVNWIKTIAGCNEKRVKSPPGEGWLTIYEIIDASPLGVVNTRRIVTDGCRSGDMDAFEGTVVGAAGRLVRRIWYRPNK